MTCLDVREQDLAEKYLLGKLDEDEQDAFELHYLACERCFEDLRLLQGVREELLRGARTAESPERAGSGAPVRPSMRRWVLMGAVAASIVLVAALVWLARRESVVITEARKTAPAEAHPAPSPPIPEAPPARTDDRAALIASLSRVEPPPYENVVLRGTEPDSARLFRQAMKSYLKRDYARTIAGLEQALTLDARPAEIHFYLGACLMLNDRVDPAIEHLRKVAVADSPFSDEAHLYLAKAYIRRGDLGEARRELEAVSAPSDGLGAETRRLKDGIARLDE